MIEIAKAAEMPIEIELWVTEENKLNMKVLRMPEKLRGASAGGGALFAYRGVEIRSVSLPEIRPNGDPIEVYLRGTDESSDKRSHAYRCYGDIQTVIDKVNEAIEMYNYELLNQ